MAINAKDFTFCNKKLSDFGFIIANFDSSSDEDVSCGNVELITARPPMSSKNIIHGVSYGEPIKLVFQVVKFDYVTCTCSSEPVTDKEYEDLMRWLVKTNYNYVNFDDGDVYFNVTMSVAAKKIGGHIHGFEITATNDSVHSYSQEYTKELKPGEIFIDESSVVGYTYPKKLVITVTENSHAYCGVLDDKAMFIDNCTAGEIITVDCENKIISSSNTAHDLSSDFNFVFFRFSNTEETRENKILTFNVETIEMTYRFKRMVTL